MAVRNNLSQTQRTRDKIKGSQLINALTKHVLEKKEMSATQVQAAKILLSKVVPDVKSIEVTGKDGENIKHDHNHTVEFVSGKATATQ